MSTALGVDGASLDPKPGDIVQHYKGHFYIVLMVTTDEETQLARVVYSDIGPLSKGQRTKAWDRTYASWIRRAPDGSPRFRNIRKA